MYNGVMLSWLIATQVAPISALVFAIPPGQRSPIHRDGIEYAQITNQMVKPVEGGSIRLKSGQDLAGTWTKLSSTNGEFKSDGLRSGYVAISVESAVPEVRLLEASGHSLCYVNGELRTGDPYSFGYTSLPVQLKKGTNEFLFYCGRGGLNFKLVPSNGTVSLDMRDATLPDLVEREREKVWGACVVKNLQPKFISSRECKLVVRQGRKESEFEVPDLLPLSVRKVGFQIDALEGSEADISIRMGKKIVDTAHVTLATRKPTETYKRTFVSSIDGSIQYFGVNPSSKSEEGQALFLSLHGASVEAIGQANAYSQKDWGTLIAPTNRRPYGFDWEDIGRLDALEVLDLAKRRYKPDPTQIYLTGHSMGGHGTWQLAAHFPAMFATAAPSAGWSSFASYTGAPEFNSLPGLDAAQNPSRTLLLKQNFKQLPVYIIHGDADDNVPVSEARLMRKELADISPKIGYHEQPGAGHWWDASPAPGADCVDWKPAFDMFKKERISDPRQVLDIDFTTISPGISSQEFWLTILQQVKPFRPTRVQAKRNGERIEITTENCATFSIDTRLAGRTFDVIRIDGVEVKPRYQPDGTLSFAKLSGWTGVSPKELKGQKSPLRSGGFKDVFRNNFLVVYGTKGSRDEQATMEQGARYLSELFWYRGNGSFDICRDRDIKRHDPKNRNVILIGNMNLNSAWHMFDPKNQVIQDKKGLVFCGKALEGSSLAFSTIRPSPFGEAFSVGYIGGNDLASLRASFRTPYFLSGAGLPDLFVFKPEMLLTGYTGVVFADFYDNSWNLASR